MGERQPMTQTIKATDVRAQWSEVVNKVARKEVRVVVEKSGVPVAAIVSADDLEQLNQLDAQRAERFKLLAGMRERFADRTEEQIVDDVTRVIAEVREEARIAPPPPQTT